MYPPKSRFTMPPNAFTADQVNQPPTVSKKLWTNADLPSNAVPPPTPNPITTGPQMGGSMDIMDDGSDPTPDIPVNTASPTVPSASTGANPIGAGRTYEPNDYVGGFLKSMEESIIDAPEQIKEYAKGAIYDLLPNMWSGIKSAVGSVGELIEDPSLLHFGQRHAPEIIEGLKGMYDTTMESGTNPREFARMMGNITGQPLATAGLVKGAPPVIRAAGTPTEFVGKQMRTNAPFSGWIPRGIAPPNLRGTERMVGTGVEKLGQAMKEVGRTPPSVSPPAPTAAAGTTTTTAPPVAPSITAPTTNPINRATTTSMPMQASVPVRPSAPTVIPPPPTPPPTVPPPTVATSTTPVAGGVAAGTVDPAAYFAAKRARYNEILTKAQAGAVTAAEQTEANLLKKQLDVLTKHDPTSPPVPSLPTSAGSKSRTRTPKVKGQQELPFEKPPVSPTAQPLPLEPVVPAEAPPVGVQPDLPFEQPHLPFAGTEPPLPPTAPPTPQLPKPVVSDLPLLPEPIPPPIASDLPLLPEPTPTGTGLKSSAPIVESDPVLRAKLQSAWNGVPPMEIPPPSAPPVSSPAPKPKVRPKKVAKQEITTPTEEPVPTKPKKGAVEPEPKPKKRSTKKDKPPDDEPPPPPSPAAGIVKPTTSPAKVAKPKLQARGITEPTTPPTPKTAKPKTESKDKVKTKKVETKKTEGSGITDPKIKEAYRLQREADARPTPKTKVTESAAPTEKPKTTKITEPAPKLADTLKKSLEDISKKKKQSLSDVVIKGEKPAALKPAKSAKINWKQVMEDMKAEGDKLSELSPERQAMKDKFMAEANKIVEAKGHLTVEDVNTIKAKMMEPAKPSITSPATKPKLVKPKKS